MINLYSILKVFLKFYMTVFYHYRVINKEKIPLKMGLIIASNHISANDPPFIGSIIPAEINYMAKIELFRNPLLAKLITGLNAIPVKRGTVDRNAIFKVEEKLNQGEAVLIFPEGTRKSTKVRAGIGKMALETGRDILPVYIKNSEYFWSCFLGIKRLKIVIGDLVKIEDFKEYGSTKENYQRISEYVMNKIRDLDNEC